jgi:hypothetical protein
MRFLEVGGIQTYVDQSEYKTLEEIGDRIAKKELSERQQHLANKLVQRGIVRRAKIKDEIYYIRAN